MIRFLFIDTERHWRGGQEQLLTLLRGLSGRGHDVHLVCHPRGLLEQRARQAGAVVHPLAIAREIGLLPFLRLRAVIRRTRADILAFNTPRAILLGNLASRPSSVKARIIFRRVNFPLRDNRITRWKYTWGIDCIVAISESIRQQLLAGGIPEHLIRMIYEGLDLAGYPERPAGRPAGAGDRLVVGTLASLSPEKGLPHLVRAAAIASRAGARLRFVIVGDGPCRRELEDLVRAEGVEDIFELVGFQDQVSGYLRAFDIFVLPSLSEGLSSAILAAMASSLPVIATDVGGIPELIRHGHNGLLVPAGDAQALAAAIRHLSAHPDEAREMGRRSRALMEERFTLERKIAETESLCYALLSRSADGAAHG